MINIIETTNRTPIIINQLFAIWEKAVRASHFFLSDDEIIKIGEDIPAALLTIPSLVVLSIDGGEPLAFMGIDGKKLEMLFVSPCEQRKGFGRMLVQTAIQHYAVDKVDVNEQNPQACCFYESMGFKFLQRSEADQQGRPYPIIQMRLEREKPVLPNSKS